MPKLINEIRYSDDNNGFSLFEFEIEKENDLSNFFKIEKYLRPENSDYLKPLFDLDKLQLDKLKFIEGKGIYAYLDGYSDGEDEDWGKDRKCFKNLLKHFKGTTCETIIDGVYLLNRDVFDHNESFVKFEEHHSYGYYIIMVWVLKSKMYVCEFTND